MRVLYLAPNIPVPGTHGGSTHVTSVHRALGRRHEVLTIARRGSKEPGVLPVGVPIGIGPTAGHLLAPVYLAMVTRAAQRFAPEVIYERYSAFGLGVALGRLVGAPCVLMTLDRDASPLSFRYADRIVATSEELIPERWRPKLREVRWGVDVAALEGADGAAIRARLAPEGERLVVYTGSCLDWHGLEILVEVAARWSGPPMRFVLVGEGVALPRMRRLAEAAGVLHRFACEGRVPHEAIGPYIAAADACVAPYAPSRHPLFRKHGMNRDPLKVLEYMALGKPALTIDTPRMRALFRNGEEAVLYAPEDAASLGAALAGLLADRARAARIGAAGRALVEARHSWDRHAEELGEVFEEARRARRR